MQIFKFSKFLIIFLFLLLPIESMAAVFYLDSQKDEYGMGESLILNIRMDVDDECINTVDTYLNFPKNMLSVIDFMAGESILSVWLERPTTENMDSINESGIVHLSGGIPGGYCGKILGDPGETNIIGSIIFKIPSFFVGTELTDQVVFSLGDTKALINDGLGTEDKVTKNDYKIKVGGKSVDGIDWRTIINSDKIAPEPFVVELHKTSGVYDDQNFLVFSTRDKQTGIDHYEVLEYSIKEEPQNINERIDQFLAKILKKEAVSAWKVAEIPYLLEDQELRSIIKVRAFDKAGNEREVEYIPKEPRTYGVPNYSLYLGTIVVILLVVIIAIIFLVIRKRRKKNQNIE